MLTRTETFEKSFFFIDLLVNGIQIRDSTFVNSFKHQLMLHYQLKLQQSFNVIICVLERRLADVSRVCAIE